MKEKPFIVQLAEFISGYSGTSKELDETLHNLQARAKSLNEELCSYKSQSKELLNKVQELQQKVDNLEQTIEKKNIEIEHLSTEICSASEQHKIDEERCNKLSKDLESISDKQNILVGYIMSAIQNSEIFSDASFTKEQVIQFLNAQLEQLLSTLDIETFEDINIHVNPLFHKIEATQYCEDVTKEGLISRSLGKGFRIGEKCIQEQPVEIFTHNL